MVVVVEWMLDAGNDKKLVEGCCVLMQLGSGVVGVECADTWKLVS